MALELILAHQRDIGVALFRRSLREYVPNIISLRPYAMVLPVLRSMRKREDRRQHLS